MNDRAPLVPGTDDLRRFAAGHHDRIWQHLGAQVIPPEYGPPGTRFAVWAPHAAEVAVVGDFNDWDAQAAPMRRIDTSGVWWAHVEGASHGDRYKFAIRTDAGEQVLRADPYARWAEIPPSDASRVFASEHTWRDGDWLHRRGQQAAQTSAISIYEVHLSSWWHPNGAAPTDYRQLAHALAAYVVDLGFTHVELLPVAEHPYGGSWGYQVSGYYAPTARFGDPDDFRYLVDHLHRNGVGVILDWVPAHFPKDDFALARFDGQPLYEPEDPLRDEHPDWGTLTFDYGRGEVMSFLVANARYWLSEFHVDGLRVDAVASMLYLDYSRAKDEWEPNEHGGPEDLDAVRLLQTLATSAQDAGTGVMLIAEESSAWPGVSRDVAEGGLGFDLKWNLGWMHDTLNYFQRDPVYRQYHHAELTFAVMYAWTEHFILPLSHDEVVHGKRSLLDKMPGDRWRKFANLRTLYAWMWSHPGKQLLFMGGEFGQLREWSEQRQLDWHLLEEDEHDRLRRLVTDLNRTYRELPALWARDDDPEAFAWLMADNAKENMFAFLRHGRDGEPPVACIANCAPLPRYDVRLGLPIGGRWVERLNTDAAAYGGSNVGNLGAVQAVWTPAHGQPASAPVTVPPLGAVWLVPDAATSGQVDQPGT